MMLLLIYPYKTCESYLCLTFWLWLKMESIGLFARESLQDAMGKDVLYDTMNRENLNWQKLAWFLFIFHDLRCYVEAPWS